MKRNKQIFQRIHTQPIIQTRYQKGLKVQGMIYLQNGNIDGEGVQTYNVQVSPQNKLLYYCCKRYKTFQYWFDYVHDQRRGMVFDRLSFGQLNAVFAIKHELDYLLYCTGLTPNEHEHRRQLPFIPMLFYQKLAAIHERIIKDQELAMRINVLAANEQYVFDLIGDSIVQIREINYVRLPEYCQICFSGAKQVTPRTLYELFQLVRGTLNKRNKLLTNSYYLIYAEIIQKQRKVQKRRILLVDGTKDLTCKQSNWDNGIIHVLNKCLLGLQRRVDNKHKESYTPFRDCKITRIIKPYLIYNSRVDVIGFVRREEDQNNFITLNLVKNLSKIQVPIKINYQSKNQYNNKFVIIKNKSVLNPQIGYDKQQQQTQNISQISSMIERIKYRSSQRLNLSQEVKKSGQQQMAIIKKLYEIRQEIKLLQKKKQIYTINQDMLLNKSSFIQNLQQKQISLKKQQQSMYIQQYQILNKNRIKTINKSPTKLSKLKLLKQYYTMAIKNQDVQIQQFIKIQNNMNHFYLNQIYGIQNDLKKSINLYMNNSGIYTDSSHRKNNRFNNSIDKSYKHNLPNINNRKRLSFIKDTVRRGRAEYTNFLKKNVQLYQMYPQKNSI